MHGIALNDIATTDEVDRALATAGFEVVEGIDRAVDGTRPSKALVPAHGRPYQDAEPEGAHRNGRRGRGTAGAAEGNHGRHQGPGSDRRRICRRRQDGDLHTAVLFPGSQAPLGKAEPSRHELPPPPIKLTATAPSECRASRRHWIWSIMD